MKETNRNKELKEEILTAEDSCSAKQKEKLSLEIESLRKKNKWETVANLMPLIATLLAVAGLIFAVFQFIGQQRIENDRIISEQRKDRMTREVDQKIRFQNQIRSDIDEILRFPRDQNQTVSRVAFLLEDVKTVMESHISENQKVADIFPDYERSLTESLVFLIRNDCDFTRNPRDVGLANMVAGHWDDYSNYLKKDLENLDYIQYKYIRALQSLRDRNPGYLEDMSLDKATGGIQISRKYEKQKDEPIRYDHFINIKKGFLAHIELLGKDNLSEEARSLKEKWLRGFQSVLCNPIISKDFLGTYFPKQPCT